MRRDRLGHLEWMATLEDPERRYVCQYSVLISAIYLFESIHRDLMDDLGRLALLETKGKMEIPALTAHLDHQDLG